MNSDAIVKVANQVVAHWQDTKDYRLELFRVVCHGPDTLYFDEFKSRQFSVGVGENLTEVSFNDLLLIYLYLAWYAPNPVQAERANKMTVNFSEEHEYGVFQQIVNRCCFEFQES